jgi:hypothetical protein
MFINVSLPEKNVSFPRGACSCATCRHETFAGHGTGVIIGTLS